ncbi:MAG: hypothetical protein ABJB76_08050 [Candidatus Nitrosocosmicus sp.]
MSLKILIVVTFFVLVFLISFNNIYINALENTVQNNIPKNIYIHNYSIYHDLDKNIIIIGSVAASQNLTLTSPVEVTLGLNAYNNISKKYDIIKEQPFRKVIYDINEPIPFKFTINPNNFQLNSNSIPYIYSIKKADSQSTRINTFTLKYNEALLGPSKELYGTVQNTAPSTIKNLTLYAIVHAKNGTQVDSVKTIVPIIKPKEIVNFSFIPNKVVKDFVSTYSCVGGSLQDINAYQSINLNSNKTLGYKFSGFMEINSLKYDNKSAQFKIEANNVYPISAALSLKLSPEQKNPLSIKIDSHDYNSKIINSNETSKIELFIPQGKHEISIQGISN